MKREEEGTDFKIKKWNNKDTFLESYKWNQKDINLNTLYICLYGFIHNRYAMNA